MIQKIKLENIQSHEDSSLEFHPGINVISGGSDQGKTAILRSLYWLTYNRPLGDSLISDWILDEKDNIQKLDVSMARVWVNENRNSVLRFKEKNRNGYSVNGEKVLEAIKTDIPKQVTDILNLSEVNIQRQLDGPFLLGDSPGQIAKFLNSLVNLEEIDLYLSLIDSKKRDNTKSLKLVTGEVESLEKKLKSMDWLGKAESILKELEKVEIELEGKSNSAKILNSSIIPYNESREKLNKLKWIGPAEFLVMDIREIESILAKNELDYKSLDDSIFNYALYLGDIEKGINLEKASILLDSWKETNIVSQKVNEKLHSLNNSLTIYYGNQELLKNNLSLFLAEKMVNKAIKVSDRLEFKKDEKNTLLNTIELYNYNMKLMETSKFFIKKLGESLPDICPLCGGKI